MAEFFWHNLSIEDTVKLLGSNSKKGLSQREAEVVRGKTGKNELPKEKPLSNLTILFDQFKSPLIYILVIAGATTLVLKEFTDAIVIFGAVILNTLVGFFQERKASRTLRELKKAVKYTAKIVREGNVKTVDSFELVPGDLFVLGPGDKVPSDARILESHNLRINEMALTGEWLPAAKKSEVLPKETSLADRDNMVYMGTVVEDGKAKAIVTETGLRSEIGKVAVMIKETKEERTPLQKKLAHFSGIIGFVIGVIAFFIFIEGMLTGNSFLEMFTTSIAVAVAAVPEGLPVALTVILAIGMQRILSRQGLVRKLLAAETLGGTSVIATDKTCTLTEGKMELAEIFVLDNRKATKDLIFKTGVLVNNAFIENPKDKAESWNIRGVPTEKAILKAGVLAGFDREKIEEKEKMVDEIVFDSVRKYGATLHKSARGKSALYVLGAPEKLLELSKIDSEDLKKANQKLQKLTESGHRVVGAAFKKFSSSKSPINLTKEIKDLNFLGLIALHDPLRKDVKEAVKICIRAGMRPIIVTGDHKFTAKAVANQLGFNVKKENVLEGKDLDLLSDKEFDKKLEAIRVFARVEPKHKLRIIDAWQRRGEIVAMTGDGINDAPALKKADIGMALGSGTEVAKETSDLILLNDSFNIIVAAVEEGRAIVDNIRKVITYLLTDSFSEVILIGGALLGGFPLPLLPAQILWVNLVEDGLPDIALAFEPKEKDLMKQKPRGHSAPLLTGEMKAIIFIIGIITDLMLLGLFFWLWNKNHDISYVRTMVFSCLTIDSLLYVLSCKSLRKNLWHINIFSNKFLIISILIGFLMLFTAIYFSPLQAMLKTVPLTANDWLIVFSLGLVELILIEITKSIFISRKRV